MRKVYHASRGKEKWLQAIVISVVFSAGLFCVIPFSHVVAKPTRMLEIRKTTVTDLPPPVEEKPPPPPDAPPQETAPPALAEEAPAPVPLMADLEIAEGAGGFLPGFIVAPAAAAEDLGSALDSFDVSELEQRPEIISQVAPAYPPDLRKARIEGSVTIVFLLSDDGRVEDPRVENSTHPEFERPALEAVRKWRFKAGVKDGEAVRTHMRLPIRFRVSSS